MDNDTEDGFQHREAFVVYANKRGFLKNKQKDFTPNFSEARLFGLAKHAAHAIVGGELKNTNVVPVSMTLDPKQIFTAILKG